MTHTQTSYLSNSRISAIFSYAVVIAFLVWVLVPITVVFINSVKPSVAIFTRTPSFIFSPTTDHFVRVLNQGQFALQLANSAIVAVGTAILSLLIGTPAAYALARIPIPGAKWWFLAFLVARMVPAIVLVAPLFILLQQLALRNTLSGLILAHTSFTLPLVIWLMHGFFRELPQELDDAAIVDGADRWHAFSWIALPLVLPGLAVTAVLVVFFSWNEFLFALVLTGGRSQTSPIGVSSFVGTLSVDWGTSSAAAVLAMLPMFVLGLAIQRFLVRGLAMGAVKG